MNVAKKPENGMIVTLSIQGFGRLFDSYLGSSFRFSLVAIIFAIELFHANRQRNLTLLWFWGTFAIIFKELLSLLLEANTTSSSLGSIYAYVLVFSISFFSYKQIVEKKVDFSEQLKIYIALCFAVQLYRIFIDYTFGGIVQLEATASYYEFGGAFFRPSNLESPVIYPIEVAIFFALILFRDISFMQKAPWLIISAISIIMTSSRSGLIMLFIFVSGFAIIKKQYIYFCLFVIICVIAFNTLDIFSRRINKMLDKNDRTYDTRFNSISTTIEQISNLDLKYSVLGLGYGSANVKNSEGKMLVYSENYPLALWANNGFVFLSIFLIYMFFCFKQGIKKRNTNTIILASLFIVNILALSLLMYSVQILFWYITFSLLQEKKKMTKLFLIEN